MPHLPVQLLDSVPAQARRASLTPACGALLHGAAMPTGQGAASGVAGEVPEPLAAHSATRLRTAVRASASR